MKTAAVIGREAACARAGSPGVGSRNSPEEDGPDGRCRETSCTAVLPGTPRGRGSPSGWKAPAGPGAHARQPPDERRIEGRQTRETAPAATNASSADGMSSTVPARRGALRLEVRARCRSHRGAVAVQRDLERMDPPRTRAWLCSSLPAAAGDRWRPCPARSGWDSRSLRLVGTRGLLRPSSAVSTGGPGAPTRYRSYGPRRRST